MLAVTCTVWVVGSVLMQGGRPFLHAYDVYNTGAAVVPSSSALVTHSHPMPPPGHTGVVDDTMPGVAGLVYVRWSPGSIVTSGHYKHEEIQLYEERAGVNSVNRDTTDDMNNKDGKAMLKASTTTGNGGGADWHNGCDADPVRRKQLLDLLALKGEDRVTVRCFRLMRCIFPTPPPNP